MKLLRNNTQKLEVFQHQIGGIILKGVEEIRRKMNE